MKTIIIFLFAFAITQANAQLTTPDTIATANGNVIVQPIFHAALVLQWNGKSVYIDPYNGAGAYSTLQKPDLVLITDIHGDHMDIKTLQALHLEKAMLVVPQAYSTMAIQRNNPVFQYVLYPCITCPMIQLPDIPKAVAMVM